MALGRITLGDFVEDFEMDLMFWNRERYERQWRDGVQRILSGALKSCLVTSIWNEQNLFGGDWWKLYRIEDQVVIQNQLIRPDIFDQNFENFDPDSPYPSIQERSSISEDGQKISEWSVPFNQITPLSF